MWPEYGYFGNSNCNFLVEKANLPENTLFYINQGYQSRKNGKKIYYTDVSIIAQIMPLAQQTKDLNDYQLKNDEVKFIRPRYNLSTGEFLGIEYCIGIVTVGNVPDEQFFDYGYNKDNAKVVLFLIQKLKIPNSFKTTIFGQHMMHYEAGSFADQGSSQLFFYLPTTVDRNEKINKYFNSVSLKPFPISAS